MSELLCLRLRQGPGAEASSIEGCSNSDGDVVGLCGKRTDEGDLTPACSVVDASEVDAPTGAFEVNAMWLLV